MKDSWDNFFETLATYGQEQLRYKEAWYSYIDDELSLSWKTGEDSGGNCWGGKSTYIPCNQPQPDFSILKEFLLTLNPDFKLRDYDSIVSLIQFSEESSREYYGNGSYFNKLSIEKKDLIIKLKEFNCLPNVTEIDKLEKLFEAKALAMIGGGQFL